MQGLAARLGESRIAQVVLLTAVLGGFLVLGGRYNQMTLVSPAERARTNALLESWLAAYRAERCERPPLREPATGDGSGDYAGLVEDRRGGPDTPVSRCLRRVSQLQNEMEEQGCKRPPCRVTPLVALPPHPDVLAGCAELFAVIDRHAHTVRACSPPSAEWSMLVFDVPLGVMNIPRAVRLEIAPLVTRGALGEAGRRVTDAMRYVQDYARNGTTLEMMIAHVMVGRLAGTLDELLADPRLRNDDARAIVRDLDVLRIDPPRVTDMWRAESISATRYDDLFLRLMNPVAGRDRALFLRGVERFLATYETQCSGASLRVCADRLRGLALVSAPDSRDDDELLASSWDPDVVRERFIAKVYADRLALWIYVDRLAKAEARLDESRARAAARAAQP